MAHLIALLRTTILAAVLAVGIGGCGATCACIALPSSPVDGVIISVNSTGLTDVHDFTLRTGDGFDLTFQLGTVENPTQFAPGHLKEHQATGSPVRVFFNQSSTGLLIVYRLEDAPASSSSP
jgi:hypothetical protein